MRCMTERLAADPASWDADARRRVVELFDRLSGEWHTRISAHRDEPLVDALDRGGPLRGPTVDIGSGIGISTDLLVTRIPPVLSLDLSMEMLRLAPSRRCVKASTLIRGEMQPGGSRTVALGDQRLPALLAGELRIRARDAAFERALLAYLGRS